MILRLTLVFALAFSGAGTALALQSGPSEFGGVRGRVIDEESGKPLVKAKVTARPENAPGSRRLRTGLTDEEGKFFFDTLPVGSYLISAAKEEDGYPFILFAPFALDSDASPEVIVRKDEIVDDVVVRLHRGGKLVGEILDSSSKQPLLTSRIRLSRVDDPHRWLTTGPDVNGHFQFALPDRPFRMEVTAPGYRPWIFGENGTQVLQVKQGSEKKLEIVLQKE